MATFDPLGPVIPPGPTTPTGTPDQLPADLSERFAAGVAAQRRRQRRVAVLGLAAVFALIGLLVRSQITAPAARTPPASVPRNDPVAADHLVAAIRRSRTSTWKVDERFSRSFGATETLHSSTRRVQSPLGSKVEGNGTVTITGDGTIITCTAASAVSAKPGTDLSATAAGYRCLKGAGSSAAMRDAALVREMVDLRSLVTGTAPLYAVTTSRSGCFLLRIRASGRVAPPFGVRADLCFDAATGAPLRSEIVRDTAKARPQATDLTAAASISPDVTPRDLEPPPDAIFDS